MLIDDKGRLFGKINLVDFLVALLLVCIIPVYYIGNMTARSKKPQVEVKIIKVEVQVKFSRVIPELAKRLAEGDVDRDEKGRIIGVLRKVVSNTPPELIAIDMIGIKDNKAVITTGSDYREIVAIFDINCFEESHTLYYRSYPIKIGNQVVFMTDLYSIMGIITDIKK
jgi:hypothetical protein